MLKHIVILGAGISGLATGWFLKQLGGPALRLTILDKSSRAGGWIQTLQAGGFLFEQGPRSCRTKGNGQETLALVEALGLQDQVLVPHPAAHNRYLYDEKGLRRLPRHVWEIPFSSLTKGWMQAIWRDWSAPKSQEPDESIHAFFTRRLGPSWTDRLVDPFVSGIYAGDCHRLSLKSCFPLLHQWEQQYGSLLRGAWHHRPVSSPSPFVRAIGRYPLFSFQKGMETLPHELAERLKEHLLLGQSIKQMQFKRGGVEIHFGHQCIEADKVISTLPSFALSSLLPSDAALAVALKELNYATVWIVNLGFSSSLSLRKGFGYLVPSHMQSLVLGCVWDSCVFPQQNTYANQTRLTVMLGGRHCPQVEQMDEQQIIASALQALDQQMNIQVKPSLVQVKKAQYAIPQFEVGYSQWKQKIEEACALLSPHLILSGSAWTGVSINDCIASARQLAQRLVHQA